jgi:hypothetical protein
LFVLNTLLNQKLLCNAKPAPSFIAIWSLHQILVLTTQEPRSRLEPKPSLDGLNRISHLKDTQKAHRRRMPAEFGFPAHITKYLCAFLHPPSYDLAAFEIGGSALFE